MHWGGAGYTLCNRPALRSLLGPLMHSAPGRKGPDKPGARQGGSMPDDQGDEIADALDRLRCVDWSADPSCVG